MPTARQTAIAAVTRAAELCELVRTDLVTVAALDKKDRSPVTVADFGSQALVCQTIRDAFPTDPIVAEEDSAQLRQSNHRTQLEQVAHYVQRFWADGGVDTVLDIIDEGNGTVGSRFWTLDPIDGTKGFLRDDQYAIALALIENGAVTVAALACPNLPEIMHKNSLRGVIFVAEQGKGASVSPLGKDDYTTLKFPAELDPERVRLVESVEAAHGNHDLQEAIGRRVGLQESLRMDSQAKYGAVARGDASLYLRLPSPSKPDYREKIWDHAAGALIVTEAGGTVTDMHGQPLDWASDYQFNHTRGVVVGHPTLHQAALEALAEI